MRGELRIKSQRSPYLRAGLGWPTREPVEVDIRDLDGERLRTLLLDPVLLVEARDESGDWHPMPEEGRQTAAEDLQRIIDFARAERPPAEDQALHLAPAELNGAVDALTADLAIARSQIDDLTVDIVELRRQRDEERARAEGLAGQVEHRDKRVHELEEQIAAATKPTTPKTPKPKPGKSEPPAEA